MKIKQGCFETTLMAVLNGVSDYFGYDYTPAQLFALSGHGFIINMHKEICPSSPYVWKYDFLFENLKNMGIEIKDLGFYSQNASSDKRKEIEALITAKLEANHPVSLLNMENQLIVAKKKNHFELSKPWECDFLSEKLTLQTWQEFGDEIHVNFFVYEKSNSLPFEKLIKVNLSNTLEALNNPANHNHPNYSFGIEAFDVWKNGLQKNGNSHGNWWNATVWGECRKQVSIFWKEMKNNVIFDKIIIEQLQEKFSYSAQMFSQVADKNTSLTTKAELLSKLKTNEYECINLLEKLLS